MKNFPENPESEWFGALHVDPIEKTKRVARVFTSVAPKYDVMNDLMSFGLHRCWKDHFLHIINPKKNQKILDVAGGTGDIAIRCAKKIDKSKGSTQDVPDITICDINPEMLETGRNKALNNGLTKGLSWVTGNAENLPFKNASFDILTIAFGLRNVTKIDDALQSFFRVLRPGGHFLCMEFSPNVHKLLKPIYEPYCSTIIPSIGHMIAQDEGAYRYLAESIQKFPDQPTLANRMEVAGFSRVSWENIMGGIAVIHSGWKI